MAKNCFTVITWLSALVVVFVLSVTIFNALDRSEVVECRKWRSEARSYPEYYILDWQNQQCLAHNIQIDAPIR